MQPTPKEVESLQKGAIKMITEKPNNFLKSMAPIECWPSMKINTDAIASSILEMVNTLPEEYQAALSIGMLPAPLMGILDKQLTDKIKGECCKIHDLPETDGYKDLFELPARKFDAIIHEISVKILQGRKNVIVDDR